MFTRVIVETNDNDNNSWVYEALDFDACMLKPDLIRKAKENNIKRLKQSIPLPGSQSCPKCTLTSFIDESETRICPICKEPPGIVTVNRFEAVRKIVNKLKRDKRGDIKCR